MKKESSAMGNGQVMGFQGPGGSPIVKRGLEAFEDLVTRCELDEIDISEVVKKRGDSWVLFDDETETQKGVFKDRETALERQRQIRAAKKDKNKHKDKPKKADGAHTSSKPKTAPKPKLAPKAKKEHLMLMFKEAVKRVMQEGSALSYIFEQDPISKSSVFWDQILESLPQEVILSDSSLKNILHDMAKAEVDVLGRAFLATRRVLQSDDFKVERGDADQDEAGNLLLNFTVSSELFDELPLFLKMENGKPVIVIPDEIEAMLAASDDEEVRKLKAFLMFAQEDQLDKMDDVQKLIKQRDEHLQKVLVQCDEIIRKLDPLKMSFMRLLLKSTYRGK